MTKSPPPNRDRNGIYGTENGAHRVANCADRKALRTLKGRVSPPTTTDSDNRYLGIGSGRYYGLKCRESLILTNFIISHQSRLKSVAALIIADSTHDRKNAEKVRHEDKKCRRMISIDAFSHISVWAFAVGGYFSLVSK